MTTKIIFSKICLEYTCPGSPETAERIGWAVKFLKTKKFTFIKPEPCADDDLLLAHSPAYVKAVKKGEIGDADSPAISGIYDYAKLSAGAAIAAAKNNAFCLMRPPGHHVGINGAALGVTTRGFCYFNNIAIAVKALGKKTLIIDFDGHHGNGTEEIFLGDENVSYLSVHRLGIYPWTGKTSRQNCINFGLPDKSGDGLYVETLKNALLSLDFAKFEQIGVSAGFDTHDGDLASIGLSSKGFSEIGKLIGKLGKPTFFVFEGGYDGETVGKDIYAFLKGFENAD
ncbi:MAG TPA: histone deacetylase [Candidatus Paceibacterota bacterium]|nr:histone deacetylase [Candidatus Pacearchaeota archaeon]HRZ51255.1 histone deacetylase [Candidatus Paceibacterota bacterium]HSA36977.1 histone deacetylase [Candidatus Paceibacterota bacterium]